MVSTKEILTTALISMVTIAVVIRIDSIRKIIGLPPAPTV
jgi:hypothetical protein